MMRDDWRALVRRVEGLTALADGVWQELDPGNRLGLQDGDPNAQACLCWLIYHVAEMTIPFLQTVSGSTAASVWAKANSRQIVGNLKTLSTNLFHHIFDSIPPEFQPPFTRDACIAFTDAQIDVMGSMGISKFEGHLRELQEKARRIYVSVHGTDDIAAFNLPPEFFHLTNAIWSLYQRVQGASGVAFATGGVQQVASSTGGVQQVASSTGSVQVISTTRTSYSVPPVVVPVYQPIAQPSGFTQPPVFSQDPAATRIGPSDFRFPPGQGTTVPGPSQRTAGTDAAANKIAAAAAAKQAPAVPKPPPAATAPKPPPAATAPKPPSVAAAAKAVVAKQAPAAPKPSAAASAKPAPAPKPSAAASAKPAPKPSAAASAKPAPKPAAAKAVKPAPKPAASSHRPAAAKAVKH